MGSYALGAACDSTLTKIFKREGLSYKSIRPGYF